MRVARILARMNRWILDEIIGEILRFQWTVLGYMFCSAAFWTCVVLDLSSGGRGGRYKYELEIDPTLYLEAD